MGLAGWIAKFGKIKLGKPLLIVVNALVILLFFLLLPYLMYLLKGLDNRLGFGEFNLGLPGFVAGIVFVLVGMSFAWWTISSQLFTGMGTPVPLLPTQKLIVSGPYRFSRNPMVFGGFLFLYGICVILGSYCSLILVTFFKSAMLLYLKLVEEKELELRFGQDYLKYKNQTKFLIPFVW